MSFVYRPMRPHGVDCCLFRLIRMICQYCLNILLIVLYRFEWSSDLINVWRRRLIFGFFLVVLFIRRHCRSCSALTVSVLRVCRTYALPSYIWQDRTRRRGENTRRVQQKLWRDRSKSQGPRRESEWWTSSSRRTRAHMKRAPQKRGCNTDR